ncbi:MAG TPA: fluoride efflux transporter CrcB [Gaiellaceae bacterium]|nr:fluoride efflux transporter CrcB [Gaiellaceae bacterium]
MIWLAVAALGGVGAVLRLELGGAVQHRWHRDLPLGTLVVNVLGSLCLGLLTGLGVAGDGLLLVGTALLGSFTTFSTLVLETERLAEEEHPRAALANLLLSVAGGLLAAGGGWALGALL